MYKCQHADYIRILIVISGPFLLKRHIGVPLFILNLIFHKRLALSLTVNKILQYFE